MKKFFLMVIFCLMIYGQACAQSRPIMGYDRVAWGASVNDVRRIYNLGNSIVLQENYEDSPDIAALEQKNVSDSIQSRTFLFNKWKGNYQLYRVWVYYKDASDNTAQNLQNLLVNTYGNITNTDRNEYIRNGLPYNQRISVFGKYSPELDVELFRGTQTLILTSSGSVYTGEITADFIDRIFMGATAEKYYLGEQKDLSVCYTWTRFRNEYRARGLGL